jgi:hypothetical protein
LSRTSFVNPGDFDSGYIRIEYSPEELEEGWPLAWACLLRESAARGSDLALLAERIDEEYLSTKVGDIVRAFDDLFHRKSAQAVAVATLKAAQLASNDIVQSLRNVFKEEDKHTLWYPVAIKTCRATLHLITRVDKPVLLKEVILSYSATIAYSLLGLERSAPRGSSPRIIISSIERGIREAVQSLVAADLSKSRANTVALLNAVAKKPLRTSE